MLGKSIASSTGKRFIQWIALSTFQTTGAWCTVYMIVTAKPILTKFDFVVTMEQWKLRLNRVFITHRSSENFSFIMQNFLANFR